MPLCPTSSDPEYVTMFSGTNPPYTFQYRFVNTKQENEMYVPANPHEAYVFGVKKATEPISVNNIADAYVNNTLADRRKILLTKKVTKWVNFYINEGTIQTGLKSVYDSEQEAKKYTTFPDLCFTYIGTFPVEIEVEL